ncbi:hypothetical protein HY768_11690 [candidate division TA06 bacterium]|uniref:Lipoprotein n=1 Tax=candidate division TA06 bacterium TaxID=2250710 RepID=A0A933IAZ2_UNCT6|nr:hypothetical protein [candidate division TA06 bacterium]
MFTISKKVILGCLVFLVFIASCSKKPLELQPQAYSGSTAETATNDNIRKNQGWFPDPSSSQDTICIFRPKIYIRTSGAPNVFIDAVYFFNNPKAIIKIVNGDSWGQYRTSAASICLNNVEIVKEK